MFISLITSCEKARVIVESFLYQLTKLVKKCQESLHVFFGILKKNKQRTRERNLRCKIDKLTNHTWVINSAATIMSANPAWII